MKRVKFKKFAKFEKSGKLPKGHKDRGVSDNSPTLCVLLNCTVLFKQNSDQGVGFMALARLAHDKARKAGIGIDI